MVKWLDGKGFDGASMRDNFLGAVTGPASGQYAEEQTPDGGLPLMSGVNNATDKVKSLAKGMFQ